MIYTLSGANSFALKAELDKLVQTFVLEHGEFALERLDGEEATVDAMRASIESLPFLTQRKLVVLREPSRQKAFTENIGDIFGALSDATDLIIFEPKLDKRLSYYKTLKKETDFRDFPELDTNGLAQWAVNYAKEHKGVLSLSHARMLVDRNGPNQQMLQNELDKLLAFNPNITQDSIENLVDRLPQSTVFELLDAAFAGNTQRTMNLYHEQRALKVEPQAIIAMLAWQLHILVVVKAAGNKPAPDVAKLAKLNPFVARKSQGLVRSVSMSRLKQLVHELLDLDIRLKRSNIDADDAVQLYLLKLATN